MKKLKFIIALMLAIVIMCVSSLPAFSATDAEWGLYLKMYDLLNLCEEAHFAYGIGYSITEPVIPGSSNKPNYLACSDTTELEKTWEEACPMVEGYFDSYMNPYDGEISIETATAKYNALREELYKIVIDRNELELLVTFCEKESNIDSYYEVQLWDDFQAEIAQAKELLADKSITDMRVNTAYFELMYMFNLLCTSNQVAEDLDNDGSMTILDATYIQRYLVGYETINSSQILVLGDYKIEDVDVLDATTIQKMCAKLSESIGSLVLENLIFDLEKSNPQSDEFELSSWRKNLVYYYSLK